MFLLAMTGMMITIIPIFVIMHDYIERWLNANATDINPLKIALCVSISAVGCLIIGHASAERDAEKAREHARWKKNGCLVYKSECGSKRKYECEVKTNIAGRVDIGDVIVESYPTCSSQ